MIQKAVEIAQKISDARDLCLRLRPKDFYERVKPYQEAIRENMDLYGQSELQVLINVLRFKGNPNTEMWFMAAVAEMLEPSKP